MNEKDRKAYDAICDYPNWNGKKITRTTNAIIVEASEDQQRLVISFRGIYVVLNFQSRKGCDEKFKTEEVSSCSHEEAVGYVYMQNLANY